MSDLISKKVIKNVVSMILFIVALCIGFYSNAFADGTEDKSYEFHSTNISANTSWERKYNNTKVYVHPISGPELNYTVRGAINASGSGEISASATHRISNGVKASITNYVREKGKLYARLHLERTTIANTVTHGVWSADSTRNYTVYG